jgi:hypothetical protein
VASQVSTAAAGATTTAGTGAAAPIAVPVAGGVIAAGLAVLGML